MIFSKLSSSALLRLFLFVTFGVVALTASSYISVPMYPVPVTAQTAVVLLTGAVCGARLGTAIVLIWLGLALLGLPLLSDGKGGVSAFLGATGGYLVGFPIAACLAGLVTTKAGIRYDALRFGVYLLLHVIILTLGGLWLSQKIGLESALANGVLPFLIGGVLKSALAAALVAVLPRQPGSKG